MIGRCRKLLSWSLSSCLTTVLFGSKGTDSLPFRSLLQNNPLQFRCYCKALSLFSEEVDSDLDKVHQSSVKRQPRWITCASTKELAFAVQQHIQPEDCVAELGAQLRDVSSKICESIQDSGSAVLVDVSRRFPQNTKEEHRIWAMRRQGAEIDFYPKVSTFYEIDNLGQWQSVFQRESREHGKSFTAFVIDVNAIVGNDLEWTTLAVARDFVAAFPSCHTVLIKSLGLNRWASRLVHGQRWIQQQGVRDDIAQRHVVATVGVKEYRRTIPHTVRPGDSVLEIGCHLGTSTVLLNQAAKSEKKGYAIGVDIGSKVVHGARARYQNVFFAVGDAWKTASLLRIQQDFYRMNSLEAKVGFDVVYVDVGGLSGSDGLLEALSLLDALMNAFEPRCIVIKSLCVQRLASMLIPSWRAQAKGPMK